VFALQFSFLCRHDYSIKHFQITQVAQEFRNAYVLDQQFQTLQDLVKFYSQCDVPNVEAIAGVRLTFPISADETFDLRYPHPRPRSVSAGDSAGSQDAREFGHSEGSDVIPAFQHSMSESRSDDALLSKRRTWFKKIVETLKPSDRKFSTQVHNRVEQFATTRASFEFVPGTLQSSSSFSENPKKYCKQPAIPDDSGSPAFSSMRKSSMQSNASFADGADALAAAAANYNVASCDADAGAAGLYYSEPRDVDRELSSDLMAHLLQQDKQEHGSGGKCVCGLYLIDSELPRGWSMHISTECGTEGRLFFTSPTGETSWELPTIVSVDLDAQQQDRIRQLMIEGQHAARRVGRQFSESDKRISV